MIAVGQAFMTLAAPGLPQTSFSTSDRQVTTCCPSPFQAQRDFVQRLLERLVAPKLLVVAENVLKDNHDAAHVLIDQAVVNRLAFPARRHDAVHSEPGQLLRHGRLPH
jgi:hypothetical protein